MVGFRYLDLALFVVVIAVACLHIYPLLTDLLCPRELKSRLTTSTSIQVLAAFKWCIPPSDVSFVATRIILRRPIIFTELDRVRELESLLFS
jgi:hypothetical protein